MNSKSVDFYQCLVTISWLKFGKPNTKTAINKYPILLIAMGSILFLYFLLMSFIFINQEDRILLETFSFKSYCWYMKIHLIILKPNTIQIFHIRVTVKFIP